MRKLIYLLPIILILSLISVNAYSYVFKQNQQVDLKISCFNDSNSLCTSITTCLLTINNPDNSNLIKNKTMTYNYNYYNYTLNSTQTSLLGEYSVIVACKGGTYAFSTFKYLINPAGEEKTGNTIIILPIILLSLIILFIIIVFKIDGKAVYILPLKISLIWLSVTLIGVLIFILKRIAEFYSSTLSTTMGTLFVVYSGLYVVFIWFMFILFFKDVINFFKNTIKGFKEGGEPL